MTALKEYVEGRRFRVMKEGARFEGLLLFGEQSISGWSRRISKGELLTCLGWKEIQVFGVNISGVMWTGLKVPDNAMVMQIWPFESIFRPYPMNGYLEEYKEPEEWEGVVNEVNSMPLPTDIDEGHVVDLTSHLPEIKAQLKHDEEVVDLTGEFNGN